MDINVGPTLIPDLTHARPRLRLLDSTVAASHEFWDRWEHPIPVSSSSVPYRFLSIPFRSTG